MRQTEIINMDLYKKSLYATQYLEANQIDKNTLSWSLRNYQNFRFKTKENEKDTTKHSKSLGEMN